jgi:hypothetical protein
MSSGYARVQQHDPGDGGGVAAAAPSFFQSLFSSPPRLDAAGAARAFAGSLRAQFDPHVPDFQGMVFDEAMATGQRTNRPVLIYLQSDLHGDTEDFLRSALCTAEVSEAARAVGFVCWAGRVHESSGFDVSRRLDACGFPFLAVFLPQASSGARGSAPARTLQRVWALEGGPVPSASALAADLRRWGSQARGVMEADDSVRRVQENSRSREREMREAQDRCVHCLPFSLAPTRLLTAAAMHACHVLHNVSP